MSQINKQLVLASNAGPGNGNGAFTWLGGKGMFTAEATFGGGSVTLQTQTANGTWITAMTPFGTAVTLTAAGMSYFELAPGQIRISITTSTAVFAYAIGVHQ